MVCPSDVCLFVDKKMSTLSETGQFMSSTYYVRVRNLNFLLLHGKADFHENDYYHSTSKSRRSQFGLTYGSACYSYSYMEKQTFRKTIITTAQVRVGDRNSG